MSDPSEFVQDVRIISLDENGLLKPYADTAVPRNYKTLTTDSFTIDGNSFNHDWNDDGSGISYANGLSIGSWGTDETFFAKSLNIYFFGTVSSPIFSKYWEGCTVIYGETNDRAILRNINALDARKGMYINVAGDKMSCEVVIPANFCPTIDLGLFQIDFYDGVVNLPTSIMALIQGEARVS